jgi:hypothetical protein
MADEFRAMIKTNTSLALSLFETLPSIIEDQEDILSERLKYMGII